MRARETPRDQYALTLREPYPIVEAQLHRLGFVRNLVSSLKFRDYAMPPETSVASWVRYPDGALASDRQLHLALFVGPNSETTDVYAHWEPSWIRHPIRHYRATAVDAETGIERIRALFERDGIEYAVVPSDERAPEWKPRKLRELGDYFSRSVVAAILLDTRSGRSDRFAGLALGALLQFLQVGLKPVEPRRLRLLVVGVDADERFHTVLDRC